MNLRTRAALLRSMLNTLKQGHVELTSVSFDPRKKSADCAYEWQGSKLHARIRVDAAQDGALGAVLHELIHAHLDEPLSAVMDKGLVEHAIYGIEVCLVKWLEKHPRQYEIWRAAIAEKQEAE